MKNLTSITLIITGFSLLFAGASYAFIEGSVAPDVEERTDLCQLVEIHKPADDVEYQPGVDVRGKEVVGADLNPAQSKIITPPSIIKIPLTIDIVKYTNITVPEGTELDSALGMIEYNLDTKKLSFNGKDITSAVNKYCKEEE